ncbi:S-adenosyl-L-methionine-dependent methyltransferase [Dunaliella salina]|uniref:S-adenosyl-L-methionine-dependent methyltransferase n=1 Tax=Dunaliella salina TaxID=3046 RepID=A0ABQ7G831_DUNSA|nr:S-adenosyl-L-methionine-dependent methyltransferase [Dunaliella salina]|eukprot:KAF5830704.1 S-adenosyl-L-methionine-dependent methyltransferase [Dunaliella salina]
MPKAKKRPKPVVAHHAKGGTVPLEGVTKQNGRHKQHTGKATCSLELAGRQKPKQKQEQHAGKKTAAAKSSGDGPVLKRTLKTHRSEDGTAVLRCKAVAARQAASAVKLLVAGDAQGTQGRSIKSLTLAPHITSKKATHAIVCQTMKFYLILLEVIKQAGLVESISGLKAGSVPEATNIPVANSSGGPPTKVLCPYNMLVIVYELLLGQGLHSSGGGMGPAEKVVLKHKDRLKATLQQMIQKHGVKDAQGLLPKGRGDFMGVPHPRSVRVNPLRAGRTVEAVVQLLRSETLPKEWKGVSKATHDACRQVTQDPLLPDVLLLPPGTDMHNHPHVIEGSLVLQSRASCMPAHALQPKPGWTCVDCCAAPGNKTTHVAALMQGKGRIIAFDKDPSRLRRLQATAQLAGAVDVIDARCQDVLSLDPASPEFAQVQGVILDPSCSGSGTVFTRMDHLLPSIQRRQQQQLQQHNQEQQHQENAETSGEGDSSEEGLSDNDRDMTEDDGQGKDSDTHEQHHSMEGLEEGLGPADLERVRHLANFQTRALRHALCFPALERLVYSTCSVHKEENEEVVRAVLEQAQAAGFDLVDPFPSWPFRGLPLFPGSEKLVRTDAFRDGTDGFFVAVFARVKKDKKEGSKKKKARK